jgi:hypothetical protein
MLLNLMIFFAFLNPGMGHAKSCFGGQFPLPVSSNSNENSGLTKTGGGSEPQMANRFRPLSSPGADRTPMRPAGTTLGFRMRHAA